MRNGGLFSGALERPTFKRAGIRSPSDKSRGGFGGIGTGAYFWPSGVNDPSYSSTTGLYYFQPQDCTFADLTTNGGGLTDYSPAGNKMKILATVGTAYSAFLDTVNPLWGTTSGHVSGTNCAGFHAPTVSALGAGDWTIEVIGYLYSIVTANIIDCRTSGAASVTVAVYYNLADTSIRFFVNGADRIASAAATVVTGRFMLAISKVAGNTRMYYGAYTPGGTIPQVGATYVDANNYVIGNGFILGGPNVATFTCNSLYDIARVTKGVGRYSGASLTAPSAPFPAY